MHSSDSHRKLAAMQYTTEDHAAVFESASFVTSTPSMEHSVMPNGGGANPVAPNSLFVRMYALNSLSSTRNRVMDRDGT